MKPVPIPSVKPGDRLSAQKENVLRQAVDRLSGGYHPGVTNSGFTALPRRPAGTGTVVLRASRDIYPIDSQEWADFLAADSDNNGLYNATLQVWDHENKAWADDPDGASVFVVVPPFSCIPADEYFQATAHAQSGYYVPTQVRSAYAVRRTGDPDVNGLATGVIVRYNADDDALEDAGEVLLICLEDA